MGLENEDSECLSKIWFPPSPDDMDHRMGLRDSPLFLVSNDFTVIKEVLQQDVLGGNIQCNQLIFYSPVVELPDHLLV